MKLYLLFFSSGCVIADQQAGFITWKCLQCRYGEGLTKSLRVEKTDSTSGFLWIHVMLPIAGFSQIWGACEVLSHGHCLPNKMLSWKSVSSE